MSSDILSYSHISTSTPNPHLSKGYYHYVVGGFGSHTCDPVKTVESYDVAGDKWVTRTDLQIGRGDLALGVINDHMFAIAGETKDNTCVNGGASGTSVPVDDVERFDSGTVFAHGHRRHAATTEVPWLVFRGGGA